VNDLFCALIEQKTKEMRAFVSIKTQQQLIHHHFLENPNGFLGSLCFKLKARAFFSLHYRF